MPSILPLSSDCQTKPFTNSADGGGTEDSAGPALRAAENIVIIEKVGIL